MKNVKVVANLNKGLEVKVGMVTRRVDREYDMVTKVTPKTITIETFYNDGSQANYFRPKRIRKADLPARKYWMPTMEEVLRGEIRGVDNRLDYVTDSERCVEYKDEADKLRRLLPALHKCLENL